MSALRTTSFFAILGASMLASANAAAADYWVDPSGTDDAAGGTSSKPWLTLQFAADHVAAGDTVHVNNGSYIGFDLRTSGTASSPIKFVGEGDSVNITAPNAKTPDGINVETADYVTIENFVINGMPRTGARCALGAFDVFRKIRADGNQYWGILTGCCTDTLIEDNVTSHSVIQHGIYFGNSGDRPIIRRNVVFGNAGAGLHMNGDISVDCSPKLTTDGIISGAVVEDNVFYDNASGSAINCAGVQDSKIQNNLVYNNHGSGISLYQGEAPEGAKNNLVVNNTIIQAADGRWGLNINQGSTGNKIRNNIFFTYHPSRGSIDITSDSISGFDSDYNLLTPRMSPDDSTTLDLAGWQALGYDKHSAASTPADNFVDPTIDFHLKAGAPAIDTGEAASAPATDITGAARPSGSGPDIGCYEYGATTAPDAGTGDASSDVSSGDASSSDGSISDTRASDGARPDSPSSGDASIPRDDALPSDASNGGSTDSSSGCGCRTPRSTSGSDDRYLVLGGIALALGAALRRRKS